MKGNYRLYLISFGKATRLEWKLKLRTVCGRTKGAGEAMTASEKIPAPKKFFQNKLRISKIWKLSKKNIKSTGV